MYQKIIIALVLLTSTICMLHGQIREDRVTGEESLQRAYIYTTDGSIIMGNLLSDNNKTVELEIVNDNRISVDHGFIDKMLLEGTYMSFTSKGRYNINRGFFANIMPFGLGISRNGGAYSGQALIGYQFNERVGYGIGMGLENTSDIISGNWYSVTTLPVYGHIRYNLNLQGPRVYALGKLGYANEVDGWWRDEISTSLFGQVGIGTAFPSRHLGRFVMELATSYTLVQGTFFDWRDQTFRSDFTKLLSRTSLRIGYSIGM